MPITVQPNEAIQDASNNYQNSFIKFSDPGDFFAMPSGSFLNFNGRIKIEWPLIDGYDEYFNYQEWKIEVSTEAYGGTNDVFCGTYNEQHYEAYFPAYLTRPDGSHYYFLSRVITLNNLFYNLSPGTYNNVARIKITADNPAGIRTTISERLYPVQAIITPAPEPFFYVRYFEGDNNALWFNYVVGSAALVTQSVFAYSYPNYQNRPNFTVELNDSSGLLTYDVENNGGFSEITLYYAFPPSQPIPGIINSSLTIIPIDGISEPVTVPITIYIRETTTAVIGVLPAAISFNAVIGQTPGPAAQTVNVFTERAWNIVSLPSWLQANITSGTGSQSVTLTAIDYTLLPVGSYNFNVVIRTDGGSATLPVLLTVSNYLQSPFNNLDLFFTKELDYLIFTSANSNTYINITLLIKIFSQQTYNVIDYYREYSVPLYGGHTDFHVGSIIQQLYDEMLTLDQVIDEFSTNFIRTQYRPAEVDIYYSECDFADNTVIQSGSITGIKFVKGLKPDMTAGKVGLLNVMQQQVSRITKNSIINCNFSHFNTPEIYVKKNGVVIQYFPFFSAARSVLYSYFRFNEDLQPGDLLEIMVKKDYSRTRRFLVLPEGLESTHIFFENQNGLIEAFEFTGRRRLSSEYTHSTTGKYKDLYAFNAKVNTKNQQSLIINTGIILQDDHKVIDAIIKSEKVWCSFESAEGPYYRIDATTGKITNVDTDNRVVSFDVEFKILDNADVTIYIQ